MVMVLVAFLILLILARAVFGEAAWESAWESASVRSLRTRRRIQARGAWRQHSREPCPFRLPSIPCGQRNPAFGECASATLEGQFHSEGGLGPLGQPWRSVLTCYRNSTDLLPSLGGYSYRICAKGKEQSEACFQVSLADVGPIISACSLKRLAMPGLRSEVRGAAQHHPLRQRLKCELSHRSN